MDGANIKNILVKFAFGFLVIVLIDLIFLNYYILADQKRLKNSVDDQPQGESSLSPHATELSESKIVNSVSPTPLESRVLTEKQIVIQNAQKEIFIPIGSGSTFGDIFSDLAGLEVEIDGNKYPAIESAVFEASLWVQDGNGKVTAQLYNETDKHPVWNSEISTSSSKGTLTTSQKIAVEAGLGKYRVQAKTDLTAFAAHVDNARIKITLK